MGSCGCWASEYDKIGQGQMQTNRDVDESTSTYLVRHSDLREVDDEVLMRVREAVLFADRDMIGRGLVGCASIGTRSAQSAAGCKWQRSRYLPGASVLMLMR